MNKWALSLFSAVVLVVGGCGDADGAGFSSELFLEAGPDAVGYLQLELVDDSRETPETPDASALPSRTLVTDVYYPAVTSGEGATVASGGPWPLVVIAHGFLSNRQAHARLAELLASHGYVVAAPNFPLNHMGAPGGPWFEDVMHQPGDVGFIIDSLVARSNASGVPLSGTIDESRVALLGHSLGAYTVFLAGLHPQERHPLVQAVIILSGSACSLPDTTFDPPNVPLLLVYADRDALIFYDEAVPPIWAAAPSPAWLVSLIDGTHTGFVHQTAELFDGLPHADTVGCDAISSGLPSEVSAEYTAWVDGLGGTLLGTECSPACSRSEILEQGMGTLRQVDLTDVAVRAFLEGVFFGNDGALGFLEAGFDAENDDVTVEAKP